jgi:uncharacterized damage-inducible protein DinB
MQERDETNRYALEALRTRVTKVLPAQIRACIEELDEEQLWWRPNAASNSVGNLVLHVCGSALHFLCRGVGGMQYERDRPAEFDAAQMSKQQLLATFDEMVEKATETFAALSPSRLAEPSTEPDYYTIVFEDLFGVAIHLANHTGQIIYITKMLREGSIDDLWTKAHREAKAWRT